MARARNIKPSFFKNETLVELPFEHRLLFVGLWTLADKEGRLEDRPKRIKMELFPADNVDVEQGLALLEQHGFIKRYSAGGFDVVQVLAFAKHQSPHHTEKASELPDVNGEITVKTRKQDGGNPPDSLIPDSLIPEETTSSTGVDRCPVAEIIKLFGEHAPSLVQPRIIPDAVRAQISARWRESENHQDLDFWQRFFAFCEQSDFLAGRTDGRGGKPFRAGLEWIVKASNFAKIINGNYHTEVAA